MRSPSTETKRSPRSPQLEKSQCSNEDPAQSKIVLKSLYSSLEVHFLKNIKILFIIRKKKEEEDSDGVKDSGWGL